MLDRYILFFLWIYKGKKTVTFIKYHNNDIRISYSFILYLYKHI